jgi:hypothetical protein
MRYASFQKDCLKVVVAVRFSSSARKLETKHGRNGYRRNVTEQPRPVFSGGSFCLLNRKNNIKK